MVALAKRRSSIWEAFKGITVGALVDGMLSLVR
jgi:hypothetical protein